MQCKRAKLTIEISSCCRSWYLQAKSIELLLLLLLFYWLIIVYKVVCFSMFDKTKQSITLFVFWYKKSFLTRLLRNKENDLTVFNDVILLDNSINTFRLCMNWQVLYILGLVFDHQKKSFEPWIFFAVGEWATSFTAAMLFCDTGQKIIPLSTIPTFNVNVRYWRINYFLANYLTNIHSHDHRFLSDCCHHKLILTTIY